MKIRVCSIGSNSLRSRDWVFMQRVSHNYDDEPDRGVYFHRHYPITLWDRKKR